MLDFRAEDGRAAFLALARQDDIIVQNFRPRVVDRISIGYDDMKAVNPDVMYLSIPSPGSVSTIPSPKDKGHRGSYLRTATRRARVTYETCCATGSPDPLPPQRRHAQPHPAKILVSARPRLTA